MWTQYQKSRQNHTKMDRIWENGTFCLFKSGIEYSIASTTIVSIFLASTAHNRTYHKSIVDSSCLVPPRYFFVTGGLICRVTSVTYARHKLVPKYKYCIIMRQKWHIFHKVDIFLKIWHLLGNIDIYSGICTYILKFGHIFLNVDIYPKI